MSREQLGDSRNAQQDLRSAAINALLSNGDNTTVLIEGDKWNIRLRDLGMCGIVVSVNGKFMPDDNVTSVTITLPDPEYLGENAPPLQQMTTKNPITETQPVYEKSPSTHTTVPIVVGYELGITIQPFFNEEYALKLANAIKDAQSFR